MAVFERGDVRIHYVEAGDPQGPPVLCIAPGGMRSVAAQWARTPYDPLQRLTRFRVIGMDQRNAGSSRAPVTATDGWASYTADQLALLDHLGIHRFHVVGMCIGGTYAVRLIRAAPERVASAVLMQPIGLDGTNRDAFLALFDGWAAAIGADHPEATAEVWAAFRSAMFGGDFLFGASREDVAACAVPLLVLMGDDVYHPQAISREVVRLAPNATLIERWKDGSARVALGPRVEAFLGS